MSFDVFLFPSTASPTGDSFRAVARELAQAAGGGIADDPLLITLADGSELELFAEGDEAGGMAAFRQMTPAICEFLYALADRTSAFILAAAEDRGPFRTASNTGAPQHEDFPTAKLVDGPSGLCAKLDPGFRDWAAFRDQALASN